MPKKRTTKILINAGTHGTEKIGLRVMESLKNIQIENGSVTFHISNRKALSKNKRFIETDLNRSFPGKENGSYEERLAYELLPMIKSFDIVIDIHSTESGLRSSVIITKLTKKTRVLAEATNARHVLYMAATKKNSFISYAKAGIGLEFGRDTSKQTFKDTRNAILLILEKFGMVESLKIKATKRKEFFHVYASDPKPRGFALCQDIKNFKLVKKGGIYAINQNTQETIRAKKSFYPILFGEIRYKDIFGFKAQKLK